MLKSLSAIVKDLLHRTSLYYHTDLFIVRCLDGDFWRIALHCDIMEFEAKKMKTQYAAVSTEVDHYLIVYSR